MSPSRVVVVALCLLAALVLQASVLARIPTPGARPDLVLVVVVAFALAKGPLVGLVVGFSAGLLLDLVGVHALGALALVLCVVGYLAGLFAIEVEQSAFIPFVVVAAATATATLLYAAVSLLASDGRVTLGAIVRSLPVSVVYNAILTPFVVPAIGVLCRRLDPSERRLR